MARRLKGKGDVIPKTVYMPPELWSELERIAVLEDRSINAQAVHFLHRAVEGYERPLMTQGKTIRRLA